MAAAAEPMTANDVADRTSTAENRPELGALLPFGGPSAPGRRWSAPARPCLYVKPAGAPSGLLGKVLLARCACGKKKV